MSLSEIKPTAANVRAWRARLAGFPPDEDRFVREAFGRILLRVEQCNAQILPNTGGDGSEKYLAAAHQLARLWRCWVRAADSWMPESDLPETQFSELARHLLADYPVPRFLDQALLDSDAYRYQPWFLHVGSGHDLRTAPGLTVPLTSRMEHCMQNAPAGTSIIGAIRWGQVMDLGGSTELAEAVNVTALGRATWDHRDEAFWLTFLQWLVNNPVLPLDQVGAVFDFVASQWFCRRAFSMTGLTIRSVRTLMKDWDRGQGRTRVVPAPKPLRKSSFGKKWTWVDEMGDLWTMQELRDLAALEAEGRAMQYSRLIYVAAVQERKCSIWSLKTQRTARSVRALTVEVNKPARTIVQAHGIGNRIPSEKELEVLSHWARAVGLHLEL